MDMPWLNHWPLTTKTQVHAQAVHVGFMVDKVALGQISFKVLQLSCQYH